MSYELLVLSVAEVWVMSVNPVRIRAFLARILFPPRCTSAITSREYPYLMLVFKNKTAAIRILSSEIAKIEAIKWRMSFKMRIVVRRSPAINIPFWNSRSRVERSRNPFTWVYSFRDIALWDFLCVPLCALCAPLCLINTHGRSKKSLILKWERSSH